MQSRMPTSQAQAKTRKRIKSITLQPGHPAARSAAPHSATGRNATGQIKTIKSHPQNQASQKRSQRARLVSHVLKHTEKRLSHAWGVARQFLQTPLGRWIGKKIGEAVWTRCAQIATALIVAAI